MLNSKLKVKVSLLIVLLLYLHIFVLIKTEKLNTVVQSRQNLKP
jgi:hypothetical protein